MDAVVEAQEAERARLAREVHDGPAQALANAIFRIDYVERVMETDPQLARAELRLLRDMLQRQLGEVRAVVSQLRPPLLDEIGLNGSILDAVEHMRTLTGLPIGTALIGERAAFELSIIAGMSSAMPGRATSMGCALIAFGSALGSTLLPALNA